MAQSTDIRGKEIATTLFNWLGSRFSPTTDEYDMLDGSFKVGDKVYGVEIKNVSIERLSKYDDIIIASNKYEYSIGDGKAKSGLTATYMLTYTEISPSTIVCMLVPFTHCLPSRRMVKFAPDHHSDNATYSNHEFYSVPREEARKFIITDQNVIRL